MEWNQNISKANKQRIYNKPTCMEKYNLSVLKPTPAILWTVSCYLMASDRPLFKKKMIFSVDGDHRTDEQIYYARFLEKYIAYMPFRP